LSSASPGFLNLQRHDGICIETGPHNPMHRRCHRADDRIANSLHYKELGDVSHQQS
jgi:hypothetical protein